MYENEKRYLERVLKEWGEFCRTHRMLEEAITKLLEQIKEYEKMEKYIIVKRNAEKKTTQFLGRKSHEYPDFDWTNDINDATIYNDYDCALLDWAYAIKWYNRDGDRIFIPIYNDEFKGQCPF